MHIVMFQAPSPLFEVKRALPNNDWNVPIVSREPPKPEWHADIAKKKAFGEQLGKGLKPFDAAQRVFGGDMTSSVWAIQHWINDPIVVDTREVVENQVNLLDKEQLCVKLLKMADEKINGQFAHELKDRTALLKLYAEIQGMTPKNGIDLSSKTIVNNEMKITFVEAEPEKQEQKTIEHRENNDDLENALPVNLKLVG